MEKQMNFVLKLSLHEMALRRVVINLWSEEDALSSIEDLRFEILPKDGNLSEWQRTVINNFEKSDRWRQTLNMIDAKVSELPLPESIKHIMRHVVKPIGSDMLRWRLLFDEAHLSDSREDSRTHLQQLYWTSAGSVDYKKTAERLIRLQTIDVVKRFRLACLYCLEDDIPILWKELPEEYKTGIKGGSNLLPSKATPLESYWAHVLLGEEPEVDFGGDIRREFSCHWHAFQYSARTGNKAAAVCFLPKLTDKERDDSLCSTINDLLLVYGPASGSRRNFPKEKLFDLFCYLLTQITPEDKMRIIGCRAFAIFSYLLDWPWQDLFADAADLIPSVPKKYHSFLLGSVCEKIMRGVCNPYLLHQFFLRCPRDFRNSLAPLLFDSLSTGCRCIPQTEVIEDIFENVDLEDGELISSLEFSKFLLFLVMADQWDIVEFCLRGVVLSKENGVRLRRAFGRFCNSIEDTFLEPGRLERFYDLLQKTEASAPTIKSSE